MATGTQSHADLTSEPESSDRPEVSVRESAPGRSVFLEAGNTDGWIACDTTLDVTR